MYMVVLQEWVEWIINSDSFSIYPRRQKCRRGFFMPNRQPRWHKWRSFFHIAPSALHNLIPALPHIFLAPKLTCWIHWPLALFTPTNCSNEKTCPLLCILSCVMRTGRPNCSEYHEFSIYSKQLHCHRRRRYSIYTWLRRTYIYLYVCSGRCEHLGSHVFNCWSNF